MRIHHAAVCALFAVAAAIPAHADPAAVTLKAAAKVQGAEIVLGDLFDGAGDRAADPVSAAPVPGGNMLFTATWLAGIAQSHGLAWHPASALAAIRVERAAVELSQDDIAKSVAKALDMDRPDRRVVLDNNLRLYAPVGGTASVIVDRLDYDSEANHFTAQVHVDGDQTGQPVHVAGRVQSLVEVAVLGRTVMPGDMIRSDDVSTSWIRVELAPPGALADPQTLIGKTPRRPLRAGSAMRAGDVELPLVVHRNDPVLIVLEQPGMYLTAQGKALEDGGAGAVIRVANVQSNRAIDAVVLGSGRVAVRPTSLAQAAD